MIVHRECKTAISDHRRVTNFIDNVNDLKTWFEYFSIHLNEPCAIMKISSVTDKKEDVDKGWSESAPYALFVDGTQKKFMIDVTNVDTDIKLLKSQGLKVEGESGHVYKQGFSDIQDQLEKSDYVIKQHKMFYNDCNKV